MNEVIRSYISVPKNLDKIGGREYMQMVLPMPSGETSQGPGGKR